VAVVEAAVLSAANGGAPIEIDQLLSTAGATNGEIGSLLGV
jgi:hypothetical protein